MRRLMKSQHYSSAGFVGVRFTGLLQQVFSGFSEGNQTRRQKKVSEAAGSLRTCPSRRSGDFSVVVQLNNTKKPKGWEECTQELREK